VSVASTSDEIMDTGDYCLKTHRQDYSSGMTLLKKLNYVSTTESFVRFL